MSVPYRLARDGWWLVPSPKRLATPPPETRAQQPRRDLAKPALRRLETAPSVAKGVAMTAHILIADDDAHIRDVIRFAAEDAGYRISEVATGADAVDAARRTPCDLIVLDIGMPEMDGFAACRAIRDFSAVPILFLTARNDEVDRILGFEFGADDYVTKPFSPRELMLRVRAILARGKADANATDTAIRHNQLSLDAERHKCLLGAQELDLTALEFSLMQALANRPERVLNRDQLIAHMYGANVYLSGRTVDSHIRNLRRKAKAAGFDDLIETVHGLGFRLGPCGG